MNVSAQQPSLWATGQPPCDFRGEAGDLRLCRISGVFVSIYARMGFTGGSMIRRQLLKMVTAFEGGPMRSGTLRRVMNQVHGIKVGAHSYGCFDPVRVPPGTRVGRYVSVGPGVVAYRRNHPHDRLSMHPYFYLPALGADSQDDVDTEPLCIGAGAWIGAGAIILPGCRRIGRGAVIAAGAVVTRDVPDYGVSGGSPARLIKYRFDDEAIKAAEDTLWWMKEPEDIRKAHAVSSPWTATQSQTEDRMS